MDRHLTHDTARIVRFSVGIVNAANIGIFSAGQQTARAEAQARALAKALVLVSAQHPAWTRHDLLKQLALVLPAETRQMSPEEAQELLLGLAEEALSEEPFRQAARWCAWRPQSGRRCPRSLRRELDGAATTAARCRAIRHRRAAVDGRAAGRARADTRRSARDPGELAARRLGAEPALLTRDCAAARTMRASTEPRGLRTDQAAAVWHVLTSPRTV